MTVAEAKTSTVNDMEVLMKIVVAGTKPSLGPESSGGCRKSAQPSAASLENLSVATASSIALPSGGASTDKSMMVDVNMPKLTDNHAEAAGNRPQTGREIMSYRVSEREWQAQGHR